MTVIRKYTADDDDAIINVWEAATRLAHPFFTEAFIVEQRSAVRDIYLPNTLTHIAERDGKVVGFISMMGKEVGAIFVEPALHGTGVGRALMDKVATGTGFLEVEVFEKNQSGIPFYLRYGFEEISRSVHDETRETLIRMRWEQ